MQITHGTCDQSCSLIPVHVSEEFQGAARDWVWFMRAGFICIVLDDPIRHLKAALQALLRPPLEGLRMQMAGGGYLWHAAQRLWRVLRLE